VALDTPSRPAADSGRYSSKGGPPSYTRYRSRRGPGRYIAAGIVLIAVLLVGGLAVVLITSHSSLKQDSTALASVKLPFGGGTIQSVSVVTGPHAKPIPVDLRGKQIWPEGRIPAGEKVSIRVVVKHPGWNSWLTGKTETLNLTMRTPSAALRHQFVTLKGNAPVRLSFNAPVSTIAYGSSASDLKRRELSDPMTNITLPRTAEAGSVWVAIAPRTWETAKPQLVSWFPQGSGASVVAYPSPGQTIKPSTPIQLTFSKPVSKALGTNMPALTPSTEGSWKKLNDHTIVFRPSGYGYGLGSKVSVTLPHGARMIGGQQSGTSDSGQWKVPRGSTVRLQQMLANLGYLPLKFRYDGATPAANPAAQEEAAVAPPRGKFDWRYPHTPNALRGMWAPGSFGTMTKGALMAFENDHAMTADGVAGPAVWKALINAAVTGHKSSFGYTFVMVNREASPQSLTLWHSGKTVLTTAVNTGIAQAPTAAGTFPVFEHLRVTTMSGTNPDGSHYSDPGIQYVSYFNGGDALHAFTRAQFGFPQSLGCVEMELGAAGQVYPYTPIGTLVQVA
jgi:peptidoglycan hydrolase-like protein with peptidoglycan-binding domain